MIHGENHITHEEFPERVQRDGIKLIHGQCEPLYTFDLEEWHGHHKGMPVEPPKPIHGPMHSRKR